LAARGVDDAVGALPDDVEVDLPGGLLALAQGRRVDTLRRRDAEQYPVILTVAGARVEV
jgi:hypothetical protein